MLTLLPTLYSQIYISSFLLLFVPIDIKKCEITNQGLYENHISWVQILLNELIFNGTDKTTLAMLTFLYYGEFVKNSSGFKILTVLLFSWVKSDPFVGQVVLFII